MKKTVVLCGNPNVGKSTVFNALTGLRQHTGNWAGKTVDCAMGTVFCQSGACTLVDLPGAYSLTGGSPDELVTSDELLLGEFDAAVVVCDATALTRSLVLALQARRICGNVLLCINLLDQAEKQGVTIDMEYLEEVLGIPVIGVCARNRQGIDRLAERICDMAAKPVLSAYEESPAPATSAEVHKALQPLTEALQPLIAQPGRRDMLALRLLCAEETVQNELFNTLGQKQEILAALQAAKAALADCSPESLRSEWTAADYAAAETLANACTHTRKQTLYAGIDRLLCRPVVSIPLMLLLLLLLFYLTLVGANAPSAWLEEVLLGFEKPMADWFGQLGMPEWCIGALVYGTYRSVAWVVSVMLPPMAIFFPLFTLLEDLGYLPRIAFHMDSCFRRCGACGKQALCMCMGLGCNAVGVTGCRIIQSPRERMIAILTNAMIPCNGRLPFLLLLITLFFSASGWGGNLAAAGILVLLLVLCVLITLLVSRLLSSTVLKGMNSTFVLELPPYRMPKIGEVLLRSVLDRTLFVLGRAVAVAAPAGLVLWFLCNVKVSGIPLLSHGAGWLDPLGRLMGMDGVILLAFMLGLPANELVLPIMMMVYLQQGMLMEPAQGTALKEILCANGWSMLTAVCTAVFTMFHWPCSTTLLTIRKETGSSFCMFAAFLLPTVTGICLCMAAAGVARLLGLA